MTAKKHERVFVLLTRLAMTALLGESLYILGQVIVMRSCPGVLVESGELIIPAAESVIMAITVYLAFALVAVKLKPQ